MDLKKTQNDLLNLMIDFNKICNENNIKYTLHGGSLLGAIRENGFIPWDDDIDIAMTRDNFTKLANYLNNDEDYCIYGRIKKQFRSKYNSNLWIDIFICDYISENTVLKSMKLLCLNILDFMNRDNNTIKLCNFDIYSKPKKFIVLSMYYFGKLFSSNFKVKLYNHISQFTFLGCRTKMMRSNDQFKGRMDIFPSNWMDSYILTQFETIELPIITKYHELLVKCYGENYMIPIKDDRNSGVHDLIRSADEMKI